MSPREMDCDEVIEQLFDFLDRELDDELSARIDRHLQQCRDCFTRAEFERRLRALVSEAAERPAPERLRRRLRRVMETF